MVSICFIPIPAAPSREEIEALILAYRFEGRCSIDAISTLLKREAIPYSSQGTEFQEQSKKAGQTSVSAKILCEYSATVWVVGIYFLRTIAP